MTYQERDKQQGLDIERQNVKSQAGLRGAEQAKDEEELRHLKVLSQMFAPGSGTAGQTQVQPAPGGTAPGQPQPTAPTPSWWDSHVDSLGLPDTIKNGLEVTGKMAGQSGAYNYAWSALEHALQTFGKKARPGLVQQNGEPVAVTDELGTPWDIHDPQLPDNLKPIARNALDAFSKKGQLSAPEISSANAMNGRLLQQLGMQMTPDVTLAEGAKKEDASRVDAHIKDLIHIRELQAARNTGASNKTTSRADESYKYNSGELDKLETPVTTIAARIGRLKDTLDQKNPQADALVAPELLSIMAGGAGSGLRMNEAEISRIIGGRSAWQNLQATIQHWSTDPTAARSITPEQDQQIRSLVQAVDSKLTAKQQALQQARTTLLNSDDPRTHRQAVNDVRQKLLDVDTGGAKQNVGGPPEGATMKVPGSDGRMHWSDGKKDLGVVQ